MSDSLKLDSVRKGSINIIWPVASAVSRLVIGIVSDWVHTRVSRGGLLAMTAALMTGTNVFITMQMEQLEVAAVMIGCCFGASWCLTPLLVGEVSVY
jgi:hypothetical protein